MMKSFERISPADEKGLENMNSFQKRVGNFRDVQWLRFAVAQRIDREVLTNERDGYPNEMAPVTLNRVFHNLSPSAQKDVEKIHQRLEQFFSQFAGTKIHSRERQDILDSLGKISGQVLPFLDGLDSKHKKRYSEFPENRDNGNGISEITEIVHYYRCLLITLNTWFRAIGDYDFLEKDDEIFQVVGGYKKTAEKVFFEYSSVFPKYFFDTCKYIDLPSGDKSRRIPGESGVNIIHRLLRPGLEHIFAPLAQEMSRILSEVDDESTAKGASVQIAELKRKYFIKAKGWIFEQIPYAEDSGGLGYFFGKARGLNCDGRSKILRDLFIEIHRYVGILARTLASSSLKIDSGSMNKLYFQKFADHVRLCEITPDGTIIAHEGVRGILLQDKDIVGTKMVPQATGNGLEIPELDRILKISAKDNESLRRFLLPGANPQFAPAKRTAFLSGAELETLLKQEGVPSTSSLLKRSAVSLMTRVTPVRFLDDGGEQEKKEEKNVGVVRVEKMGSSTDKVAAINVSNASHIQQGQSDVSGASVALGRAKEFPISPFRMGVLGGALAVAGGVLKATHEPEEKRQLEPQAEMTMMNVAPEWESAVQRRWDESVDVGDVFDEEAHIEERIVFNAEKGEVKISLKKGEKYIDALALSVLLSSDTFWEEIAKQEKPFAEEAVKYVVISGGNVDEKAQQRAWDAFARDDAGWEGKMTVRKPLRKK